MLSKMNFLKKHAAERKDKSFRYIYIYIFKKYSGLRAKVRAAGWCDCASLRKPVRACELLSGSGQARCHPCLPPPPNFDFTCFLCYIPRLLIFLRSLFVVS